MYMINEGHLYRYRNNKIMTCIICCTTSMIFIFIFKKFPNRLLLHTSMSIEGDLSDHGLVLTYLTLKGICFSNTTHKISFKYTTQLYFVLCLFISTETIHQLLSSKSKSLETHYDSGSKNGTLNSVNG